MTDSARISEMAVNSTVFVDIALIPNIQAKTLDGTFKKFGEIFRIFINR